MDLDDIKEAQGWSDTTLLLILTDFLHHWSLYKRAVRYAEAVAERENS